MSGPAASSQIPVRTPPSFGWQRLRPQSLSFLSFFPLRVISGAPAQHLALSSYCACSAVVAGATFQVRDSESENRKNGQYNCISLLSEPKKAISLCFLSHSLRPRRPAVGRLRRRSRRRRSCSWPWRCRSRRRRSRRSQRRSWQISTGCNNSSRRCKRRRKR